jgi:predicted transcriptional regulator
MKLTVSQVMNREPVTICEDYTVYETAQMMIDFGLETLIVTSSEDAILGIVTYRDVLECLLYHSFNPDQVTVGEITDEEVIMVRPGTRLSDVVDIMLETDRSTLPVVENDLVGYVSYTDILKLVNTLKVEKEEEAEHFDPTYYII